MQTTKFLNKNFKNKYSNAQNLPRRRKAHQRGEKGNRRADQTND